MKRQPDFLLLILGLGLIVLGQVYFLRLPQYVWDGVIFCGLGAFLWMIAWRRTLASPEGRPSGYRRLLADVADHPLRAALLGVGVLLVLWAGVGARRADPAADFSPYLRAWALGLLLYLVALVPLRPAPCALRRAPLRRAPLLLLLLAAFLARAVALEHIPANFGGDEGTQALAGWHLLGPPLGNPFATGWYSVPTMSFLVAGLGMKLFGATVAGARLLSALAGTASVLATYLLARRLAGEWVGWGAGVLVAFGHYGLHFSRLASNQMADALWGPLVLYFLLRSLGESDRLRHLYFALTGGILGLSWYTYFGARLMTVVVALYLLGRALREGSAFLARHGRGLALLAIGFALAVWPLTLYYIAHPADFLSRYNQVSIFASGWLEREVALTGRSATALLLQQFWKSVSAFNVTPDPTFWYRPGVPLLDPLSGVFFILGLVVAFWGVRRPGWGLLLLWFWAYILGWTWTENPPSSQRGVGLIPAVAILTALGLTENLETLCSSLREQTRRTVRISLFALLLAAITVVNLFFYFQVYTPRRVYGNPTAEVADVLCDVLESRAAVPPVYLDGAPFLYWDFGAIAFRLRDVAGRDFSPETDIGTVDPSRGALFVVLAEKSANLDRLRSAFPGGKEIPFYSEVDGRLLFVFYEVGGDGS